MDQTISSEETLRFIQVLNGIDGLDSIRKKFYYDETNNYRKVYLLGNRLNIEGDADFILGGVVLENNDSIELDDLRREIKLDKSAKEMKFKHVARGGFISALRSRKIRSIFDFILQNNILIHIQRVDVFYWFIIDIIESVMIEDEIIMLNHLHIKDKFYWKLIKNKSSVLGLLNKFNYPDVHNDQLFSFYGELLSIVESKKPVDFIDTLLVSVLKLGENLEEAVFIQNEERGLLLDDFSIFYRNRILTFPRSHHCFDSEDKVEKELNKIKNSFKSKNLENYSFVDSKQDPHIQLADVVVGYFSRLYAFCKGRSDAELYAIRHELNKDQLDTLKKSRTIIDKSDDENQAYFNSIIPISDGATWSELAY